jgi:hypothetical protein
MRLIRRIEGRHGSLSLYRHQDGLAEVITVTEGGKELIELRQYTEEFGPQLLRYMDEVQSGIDQVDAAARLLTRDRSHQCQLGK